MYLKTTKIRLHLTAKSAPFTVRVSTKSVSSNVRLTAHWHILVQQGRNSSVLGKAKENVIRDMR